MSNQELKSSIEVRVRFNETDALGIVWHGNYLKYFEDGREAFGRAFGLSFLDIKKHGFTCPIVKTLVEHKKPLKYGDVATVETQYMDSEAAKLIFHYSIKNESNEIVCTGETTQVFIEEATGNMALVHPKFFKLWKQKKVY